MKLHKATGQAYVRHEGKCKYFGKWGLLETEQRYRQWLAGGKSTATCCKIADLIERYNLDRPSKNHADKVKAVSDLGPVASLTVDQYSPLAYRKHREHLDNGNRCARHINDLMRLMQRIFRWGVSMELVPLEVYERLKTVDPLKPHEVEHQSTPRKPVKREHVERTLKELHQMPADIIRLLLYTGARPGEICGMRGSEIDQYGPQDTWVYRPSKHKTGHHGKRRYIVFGKQGQAILAKYMTSGHLFPSSVIIGHYQPASLRQAVYHACGRVGLSHWTPYQLRHLRMTELSIDKGLEVAASVAGHGELGTTRGYTHEPDAETLKKAV